MGSLVFEVALEPMGPPSSQHAMVCCSGFLINPSDMFAPWEVHHEGPWTLAQVFALRHETELLLKLGHHLRDTLGRATKRAVFLTNVLISLANPVSMTQRVLDLALEEFYDLIDFACFRAAQAGVLLARQLVTTASDQSRHHARPVSLVGYSTGGVLIYSCLLELRRLADFAEHRCAGDLICNVVILGAPIPTSNTEEWASLRQLASGRFINGYVRSDVDMLWHASRRGVPSYAACAPLSKVPGVENVQLDEFVTVHAEYAQQTPA